MAGIETGKGRGNETAVSDEEKAKQKARDDIRSGKSVAMKGHGLDKGKEGGVLAQVTQEELGRLRLGTTADSKFGSGTERDLRTAQLAYNQRNNLSEGQEGYIKPDGKLGKDSLKAFEKVDKFSDEELARARSTLKPEKGSVQRDHSQDIKRPAVEDRKKEDAPVPAASRTPDARKGAGAERAEVKPEPPVTSPPTEQRTDSAQVSAQEKSWQELQSKANAEKDALEKGKKGALAASAMSAKDIEINDRNRDERPLADKIIGALHNDQKEHDLRNEGLQAASNAYYNRAESLEAAKVALDHQVRQAEALRQEGKTEEAHKLMAETIKGAQAAREQKADLRVAQQKQEEARRETDITMRQTEAATAVLEGALVTPEVMGALVVGGPALKVAVKGVQYLGKGVQAMASMRGTQFAQSGVARAAAPTPRVNPPTVRSAPPGAGSPAPQPRPSPGQQPSSPRPMAEEPVTKPNHIHPRQAESPVLPQRPAGSPVEVPPNLRPAVETGMTKAGNEVRFVPRNVEESVTPLGNGRYSYQARYDLTKETLGADGKVSKIEVMERQATHSTFEVKPKP